MVSISHALRQVKDDLPRLIEQHTHEALSQFPDFLWRDRLLSPLVTLLLFITQVMHGNTAITPLRHLAGLAFTATAYGKARQRLPLTLVQQITRSLSREVVSQHDGEVPRWRGHRVWRADGSGFSMPDTPELRDHFGQPSQQRGGCGFPVATLLLLCDAAGFIHKTLALPQARQAVSGAPALRRASIAVAQAAGQARSARALVQAQAAARVDGAGRLRGAAGIAGGA